MSSPPTQPPIPVIRIKPKRNTVAIVVLSIALGASLLVNIFAIAEIATNRTASAQSPSGESEPAVRGPEPLAILDADTLDSGEAPSVREIYERVIDSVSTLECSRSQGTGFALALSPPAGYASVIVTNYHVVEACASSGQDVVIRGSDGTRGLGQVYSVDTEHDLALVATSDTFPVLSTARDGRIGDAVLAIGSPLGLDGTLTQGIISNLGETYYQTDAAINVGNSGGPLLDMQGMVLGVNTARADGEGIGIVRRIELMCEKLVTC